MRFKLDKLRFKFGQYGLKSDKLRFKFSKYGLKSDKLRFKLWSSLRTYVFEWVSPR